MKDSAQEDDLQERLTGFAVQAIDVVQSLPHTRVGNHVAGHLLRAGTAPAANYGMAQSAESATELVHMMKVILKSLRVGRVWLRIIQRRKLIKVVTKVKPILAECDELIAVLGGRIHDAQEEE